MKSRCNKTIALSISIICVAVLASSTASLAWFQNQAFASIENLSLATRSSTDLRVGYRAGGGIAYKTSLSEEDFLRMDPEFEEHAQLGDVSGMFQSSWNNESCDYRTAVPVLYAPYKEKGGRVTSEPATDSFLQLEFFLRCNQSCHLYLDESSCIQTESGKNEGLSGYRLSIFCKDGYYIIDPAKATGHATRYGGLLDIQDPLGYFDHEDGREIIYGDYQGEPTYQEALSEDLLIEGEIATHKAGVERADLDSVSFAYEETYYLHDFFYRPRSKNNRPLAILEAEEDYRLVITMYLEGWDLGLVEGMKRESFQTRIEFLAVMDL